MVKDMLSDQDLIGVSRSGAKTAPAGNPVLLDRAIVIVGSSALTNPTKLPTCCRN